MANQSFGGPWTERKLKCLRDYLNAYPTIFTGNPKARYFRTWYVDAFAGTGSRVTATDNTPAPLLNIYEDKDANTEAQEYQDGSAKIALGLPSPFDNYLFIEKSKARKRASIRHPVRFFPTVRPLPVPHRRRQRRDQRVVRRSRLVKRSAPSFFSIPTGMQVKWSTVETLAATKGVDLWYLFPGIARLLRRDGNIDEKWKARLDIPLGTDGWRTRFFHTYRRTDLFGETEGIERTATEEAIQSLILERLATCFGKKVAKGLILRNSKSSPLYFLCFAASNERGARPALNIANSILGG